MIYGSFYIIIIIITIIIIIIITIIVLIIINTTVWIMIATKMHSIKIDTVFNSNMFECYTHMFNKTNKEYLACVQCMFNTFSCSFNNTSQ